MCLKRKSCQTQYNADGDRQVKYDFSLLEPEGVNYIDSSKVAAESEQALKALNVSNVETLHNHNTDCYGLKVRLDTNSPDLFIDFLCLFYST